MRRTPNTPEKAARSANSRLEANQAALQRAYRADAEAGVDGGLRNQFQVATAWLRSEVTALAPGQRQQLLDHLVELCQTANVQSRMTVVPDRAHA